MKLLKETIETCQVLQEKTESGVKKLYIEGPMLVGNTVNKNNRMYTMDTLRKEVARYIKEMIDTNRAIGELGHPDTPALSYDRASHKIISLRESGNCFIGKAVVLTALPCGKIVEGLINEGVAVGMSSRALGSVQTTKEGYNLVQDDFRLSTAADIVADPSAPGAFAQGIMENKEWLIVDGHYVEADLEHDKRIIRTTPKKQLEEVALKLFENYLQKL